jgi:hypothetical protein
LLVKTKIKNWTQRKTVSPDVVRPPSILAAKLARPDSPTAFSAPGTDSEDTSYHSTHEESIATDDSVSHWHVYFLADADALLGRISSHS